MSLSKPASDLAGKLKQVALLKAQIDKLAPLKVELEQLKFEIMIDMQDSGSRRSEAYDGYFAIRATRTNLAVADPGAVEDWLALNEFNIDEYTKLDETRVKALAESQLKETGEVIPGLESTETEYITIKKEVK